MPEIVEIRPQAGPQEMFLSTPADVAFYGGAAGGGKTYSLLMEPIRHLEMNGGFGGVIFRRVSPQITNEGGLWDTSMELYPLIGGEPKIGSLRWVFPAGSSIMFRHLQYEETVEDWQGAQIPYIAFDELTHFSRDQFFYMLSRNRSTCGVRPYVRAGMNPDAESWVAEFIEWWIDPETGFPIPERSGVVRYFCRFDGQIYWADEKENLIELMRERFPELSDEEADNSVKSFTFIAARLQDNKILMKKDPGYIGNLLAQNDVDRARLLDGNWKVKTTAGKIVDRAWFGIVPAAPSGGTICVGWDFASTGKQLKSKRARNPDFTARVTVKKIDGKFYILDFVQKQVSSVVVEHEFKSYSEQQAMLAKIERARFKVRWGRGKGDAGDRDNQRMTAMLPMVDAHGIDETGDKYQRGAGFAAQARVGNVLLVEGKWNREYLEHMHGQPDLPKDDGWDATINAYRGLVGEIGTPRQTGGVLARPAPSAPRTSRWQRDRSKQRVRPKGKGLV